MVAGPEVARSIKEFEVTFQTPQAGDTRHHEQTPSTQRSFAKDVISLTSVIEEMGNPFTEDSLDLLVLNTKEIMPKTVVDTAQSIGTIVQSQHDSYVADRLEKHIVAITDTIPRNNFPLFGTSPTFRTKKQTHLSSLKSDCNLFARLYIACQTREGNLEFFFAM